MPVRKAQYAHASLHPIFQMNLPEGFLLEELQNRLAKIVNLEPMLLLALSSGQAPIGRVAVRSDFVNPLASALGQGHVQSVTSSNSSTTLREGLYQASAIDLQK